MFGSQGRGLDLGCFNALQCESATCQSRSSIFEVKNFVMTLCGTESLGHSVLGQDVSGAGRCGTKICGAGRHWGRTSVGQEVLGQEVGNPTHLVLNSMCKTTI